MKKRATEQIPKIKARASFLICEKFFSEGDNVRDTNPMGPSLPSGILHESTTPSL